jgi:hypothetical protein
MTVVIAVVPLITGLLTARVDMCSLLVTASLRTWVPSSNRVARVLWSQVVQQEVKGTRSEGVNQVLPTQRSVCSEASEGSDGSEGGEEWLSVWILISLRSW